MRKRLRKKPRVEWLIDSTEHSHLVRWFDGKREWISWELVNSSFNRKIEYRVRGHDLFYTRREAERAIDQLPFPIFLERHQGDSLKTWTYSTPRKRVKDSSDELFKIGDIATISCSGLRTFAQEVWPISSTYLIVGTLVLIVETRLSGALSRIAVGDETGWIETRYLLPATRCV